MPTSEQDQIAHLVEAYGQMLGTLDPRELFPAILELSRRFIEADAYAVWRTDLATGDWSIAVSEGLSKEYVKESIRFGGTRHELPGPVVVEDVLASPMLILANRTEGYRREGICSIIIIPMRMHGDFIGTIVFYYRTTKRFSQSEIRLATAFGNLAASAMSTSDLYIAEQTARAEAEAARHAALAELAERRRAETELVRREQRFAALIDQAMDIISIVDRRGIIRYQSPSVERILGYKPSEFEGALAFDFVHPDDVAVAAGAFETIVLQPDGVETVTYRFRHKDGSWKHLESVGRALLEEAEDEGGEPVPLVVINSRDITDRARTDEELRRRQAAIEALNLRLRRAMVETHHRVKNNLQIIAAMLDMRLMEGAEQFPAEDLRRLASHIRTLAEVHNLLTQDAKEDGTAATISSRAILERLLPLVREAASGRTIDAIIDDTPLALKQGTSLALITNELVSNAVKYGGEKIGITFRVDHGSATFAVVDDGPGFPQGFDPRTDSGTGLDLVESLGRWDLNGAVSFENGLQGGACIRIVMPLAGASIHS